MGSGFKRHGVVVLHHVNMNSVLIQEVSTLAASQFGSESRSVMVNGS